MSPNTIFISVILTVIILCALAIFLIIYFLLYSSRLKNAVKQGRADRPMPAISVYAMMFLCMVFLAASVFTVSGIVESGQRLDKLTEQMTEQKEKLDEIVTKELYTYGLVWEAREDISAGSMIRYADFSYGSYHSEDHSIDVTIKTAPRITGAKDVTFYYEGQPVPLTPGNGGEYTGTFRADIFNSRTEGLLTIETEKVTLSEIVSDNQRSTDAPYHKLVTEHIPSFVIDTNPSDTDSSQKEQAYALEHTLQYRNDYRIVIISPEKNSSFAIDKAELVTRLNGSIIDKQDITESLRKGTKDENGNTVIPSVKVDSTFKNCTDSDFAEILFSITDKDGYSYQVPLYMHGDKTVSGRLTDSRGHIIYIYDKDGNTLSAPEVK